MEQQCLFSAISLLHYCCEQPASRLKFKQQMRPNEQETVN